MCISLKYVHITLQFQIYQELHVKGNIENIYTKSFNRVSFPFITDYAFPNIIEYYINHSLPNFF